MWPFMLLSKGNDSLSITLGSLELRNDYVINRLFIHHCWKGLSAKGPNIAPTWVGFQVADAWFGRAGGVVPLNPMGSQTAAYLAVAVPPRRMSYHLRLCVYHHGCYIRTGQQVASACVFGSWTQRRLWLG